MPDDEYLHFLHLYVACRILCSKELAIPYADSAEKLLKKFVYLMPTYYGQDSKVLHVHNLIHLSDDVKHSKSSLPEYSAFWGENYIGKFKTLVSGRAKPLAQIVNRLIALNKSENVRIKKKRKR